MININRLSFNGNKGYLFRMWFVYDQTGRFDVPSYWWLLQQFLPDRCEQSSIFHRINIYKYLKTFYDTQTGKKHMNSISQRKLTNSTSNENRKEQPKY